MNDSLGVWRFDDGVVQTHVIAASKDDAIAIFDRHMGRGYREEFDDVTVDIFRLPDDTELPITFDGIEFVNKTAKQWISHDATPRFL